MAIKKEIDGRGSDNIFYPEKLSPQGFLTDFITAQIHSNAAPFPELKQIIYQNDFLSKVNNKLVFLHPKDDKDLLVKDIPKTMKDSGDSDGWWNEYKRRRYINFLNTMTPAQQAVLVPYIRIFVKQFIREKSVKRFVKTREIVFNQDYRIPNAASPANAGAGRGNAGITRLQVDRDFQYYGVDNKLTVSIDYIFDSYDTFANGMQVDNVFGTAASTIQGAGFSLFGQDQGSGYINLIKKGVENTDGGVIEEVLYLQYGYKFPETLSEEIVPAETRKIFEEQEKKELVIVCYKHDFRFSETGEVVLNVSYYAYPDHSLFSRSEEKTNDVFLITNQSVIDEIIDTPPPALNIGNFLEMTEIDQLNERINWQTWLIENFSSLYWK